PYEVCWSGCTSVKHGRAVHDEQGRSQMESILAMEAEAIGDFVKGLRGRMPIQNLGTKAEQCDPLSSRCEDRPKDRENPEQLECLGNCRALTKSWIFHYAGSHLSQLYRVFPESLRPVP